MSKSLLITVAASTLAAFAMQASSPIDLGALFTYSGTFSGGGTASGSVYDKDIHSGVFGDTQHSPSYITGGPTLLSDSYVFQGGHPYGNDTGDAFELAQAPGHLSLGSGLDLYTVYISTDPSPQAGNHIAPAGGPDNGYFELVNNSRNDFVGTIGVSGLAGDGNFYSNGGGVTLAPGDKVYVTFNDETSNHGGYNAVPEPAATTAVVGAIVGLGALVLRRRSR
jgi:hypothetical protein